MLHSDSDVWSRVIVVVRSHHQHI